MYQLLLKIQKLFQCVFEHYVSIVAHVESPTNYIIELLIDG